MNKKELHRAISAAAKALDLKPADFLVDRARATVDARLKLVKKLHKSGATVEELAAAFGKDRIIIRGYIDPKVLERRREQSAAAQRARRAAASKQPKKRKAKKVAAPAKKAAAAAAKPPKKTSAKKAARSPAKPAKPRAPKPASVTTPSADPLSI